jgi:hypothetical protein
MGTLADALFVMLGEQASGHILGEKATRPVAKKGQDIPD